MTRLDFYLRKTTCCRQGKKKKRGQEIGMRENREKSFRKGTWSTNVLLRQSPSPVGLFVTPWPAACQAPLSMGLSRQISECGSSCLLEIHPTTSSQRGLEGGESVIVNNWETIELNRNERQKTVCLGLGLFFFFYKTLYLYITLFLFIHNCTRLPWQLRG